MKQDKSKWISVDQLPDNYGQYKVRDSEGMEFIAFFTRTFDGSMVFLTPSQSFVVHEWEQKPPTPEQ